MKIGVVILANADHPSLPGALTRIIFVRFEMFFQLLYIILYVKQVVVTLWSIDIAFVANRSHELTFFCQSLISLMGLQDGPIPKVIVYLLILKKKLFQLFLLFVCVCVRGKMFQVIGPCT